MPEYEVKIVDAFTTTRYAGNPCGVITRADGLNEAQMQAIARELNLSETAFVFPSIRADFSVRFFTPAKEIPLAGHPTIATMHTLFEEGRIEVPAVGKRIVQELSIGVLPVHLERIANGVKVKMTQAKPEFLRRLDKNVLATALGIESGDILAGVPPQVVSTGTPQAMIPVKSIDVLRRLRPDFQHLGDLEEFGEYYSTHVFAIEALDPANRTHARHFAANAGIPEDPVTGSATGAMAAYLWKYGLVREPTFNAEQGHLIGRPGVVEVEVDANGEDPVEVRIAGTAITVLRGTITV